MGANRIPDENNREQLLEYGVLAVTAPDGTKMGAKAMTLAGSNLRENPFSTETGQDVMSVSESFWARLFREGRPRMNLAQGTAAGAVGVAFYTATVNVSPGCEFVPRRVCISCDQDAQLLVKIATNYPDVNFDGVGAYYEEVFAKAGTPLVLHFDGEVRTNEGGAVSIGVIPNVVGAKVYGSIYGLEVTLSV